MKDLTKYYIDLSKCTEEQRKHIFSLLPDPEKVRDYHYNGYLIDPEFNEEIESLIQKHKQ